ncbi:DUF6912 family protein [Nocardioides sp. Kera G14]|uniref:DUF6912 family protein n=1 Tax=Nocardioides sp. Kera G14 TaxID=2884264 RepID=UPI001D120513|nr:hypothetical protein [Nocardioides sp. Kera G14]UDY22820.1 hypothetical protein LH076_12175 [Nocardioides sp. Kera G14]
MRLYLPATLELLREWYAAGSLPSSALDEAYQAPDDSEEGEYAALMSAADASTALSGRGGRRVVVVLDDAVGDVPLQRWAAVHADTEDRGPDDDPDDDLGWFAIPEIPELL